MFHFITNKLIHNVVAKRKFAQPSRVSKYYEYDCRSRFDFRKFSTLLIGCFLIELTFLSQMSAFSRNLNHCGRVQTKRKISLVITFWNFIIIHRISLAIVLWNLININRIGIRFALRAGKQIDT